jgi:type III secretory pathway component EscS
VAPKKRTEIAWVVTLLLGLVIFQQFNALGTYTVIDDWLNNLIHFPNYPNPIDYIAVIGVVVGILAGITFLLSRALAFKTKIARSFSSWFAPLMYGLIPLMGADYVARAMPKFFNHAARLPASILAIFGKDVAWADFHILPNDWLVRLQFGIAGLGMLAALYAIYKIAGKDLKGLTPYGKLVRVIPSLLVLCIGVGIIAFFFFMNGAE